MTQCCLDCVAAYTGLPYLDGGIIVASSKISLGGIKLKQVNDQDIRILGRFSIISSIRNASGRKYLPGKKTSFTDDNWVLEEET